MHHCKKCTPTHSRKPTEKLTERACVCFSSLRGKLCLPVSFLSSHPLLVPSFVSEVPLTIVLCFSVYSGVRGTERLRNTHVFTQTHRHRETSLHSHTHTHTHSHVQGQYPPYTGDTHLHTNLISGPLGEP